MPLNWKATADELGDAIEAILPNHFVLMVPGGFGEGRRLETLRSPSVLFGLIAIDGTVTGTGLGGPVRRWNVTVLDGELRSADARRTGLLDAAATLRAELASALADSGITMVTYRERLLSTASIANVWEMELLEYLADPALESPVIGTALEELGTLSAEWDDDATEGTLTIGDTIPSVGDILVLEASGGSPRLSLGRVLSVDALLIETQRAPGVAFPAGSTVHRIANPLLMPCAPSPVGPGPTSRRATEIDQPVTTAASAVLGAAGAWERDLRFAPIPLLAARDIAESIAALAAEEELVFVDEWRRVLNAEVSTPPQWESLGDSWGAASFSLSNPT